MSKKFRDIEFNNGFITAIALFLEHRDNDFEISRTERIKMNYGDHRMYAATDHLYDLEIPKRLPETLKKRIIRWQRRCFENRLKGHKKNQFEVNDSLFKEGEDILIKIDESVFKTKKVRCNYR